MKKKDLIETLIENQEKVESQDIKDALDMFKQEQSAKNKDRILMNLRSIEKDLDFAVGELRKVRKAEKNIKKMVQNINDAKEQFMKDGDWQAYLRTRNIIL